MPNCPKCNKPVYFAEKKTSLGKDWHPMCLKCVKCNKLLSSGQHDEHEGQPYCNSCYRQEFGPKGFRAGTSGADSFVGIGKDKK